MANSLGLEAIGWQAMTEHWWNLTAAIVVLVCIILGASHIIFLLFRRFREYQKRRRDEQAKVPPSALVDFLASLPEDIRSLLPQGRPLSKPPTSFGAYFGSFGNPPWEFRNPNQTKLLSQWDLVVLDPYQPGVVEAAAESTSAHVVGRLDVSELDCVRGTSKPADAEKLLSELIRRLTTDFKRRSEPSSPFSGVLLANWQLQLPPVRLNPLLRNLKRLNVSVYLELAPPNYLTEDESLQIQLELVDGLVCHNVTILPNGEPCNYFQMTEMRRAQRAFAKHAWLGKSTFMMLETLHNGVELSHSVLKRSFNWSRYNSALSWIGPRAALTDSDVAVEKTYSSEPLGALMWLKTNEVMAVHEAWRTNRRISQRPSECAEAFQSLEGVMPGLSKHLQPELLPQSTVSRANNHANIAGDFDWPSEHPLRQRDVLSSSAAGESFTGLGCFQLGLQCTSADFDGLVEGQRRLRDLNMLQQVEYEELQSMAQSLRVLYRSCSQTDPLKSALGELLDLLETHGEGEEKHAQIRVYVGLHSGFHNGSDNQFWGLFDGNDTGQYKDIFLSAKTPDRTSTLLHTFLSSREFSRRACFQAECALALHTGLQAENECLPQRLVQDVEKLTPAESLLLLQRLKGPFHYNSDSLEARIAASCETQLIDVPSLAQSRHLSTEEYLHGNVSAEEVVRARLEWLRDQGAAAVPSDEAALSVFGDFDARLPIILMKNEVHHLDQIAKVLQQVVQKGQIDARVDILALSVFSAFRKLAVHEIYLEILDRNPLPNSHPDQAACFAEMFALGAQCEAYLDMTPEAVGRVLAARYWTYYRENQPPRRDDQATELPTAYASMNTDEDPNAASGKAALPVHYRLTFLGIFAVPALVDILLLTLVGRGLYLSTFMGEVEKTMATAGLMVGLLLVGGIGTWVGHGGSYYLHCMSFPAMNMFVLTRLIAGLAIGLIVGVGALIVLGCIKGFYAGFIFFFYFFALSTYLTMLATLAVYQFPDFAFQSGRSAVVKCIPLLLISPIATTFAGHDIIVYPIVLCGFLATLIYASRSVFAQWHSWYSNVPIVSDTELVHWFQGKSTTGKEKMPSDLGQTDLASTPLPRTALMAEVTKERSRRPWTRSTTDDFVRTVARGHDATLLLMDWYCKYSRTKMPYPYSPTWNLQVKAAVDTLKDMQKGLKLHNAFIHWRESGPEVWCGVLYFVVALMDKWVALLTGGALVGLSAADSSRYRLSVGFGLSYYLIAAVCLDAVATPLWPIANKRTSTKIDSLETLREVAVIDIKARRKVYWSNFGSFFFMHVWGIALMTALLWTFEGDEKAIIMFLAYVGAYSGLLWYQYNRVYTGALAIDDLVTGAIVGLVTGLVLRSCTELEFSGVIGLAAATWTTALLSMWTAKIRLPRFRRRNGDHHTEKDEDATFYYSGSLWASPELSQRTLSNIFNKALTVPEEERFDVVPSVAPGVEALRILSTCNTIPKSTAFQAAFPQAAQVAETASRLWKDGKVVVELVPASLVFDQDPLLTTISRNRGSTLHVIVFVGHESSHPQKRMVDIGKNSQIIAEAVMQATSQAKLGFSYDQSVLAELIVTPEVAVGASVPWGLRHHLEWSSAERARVIRTGDRAFLCYLLLGLDADLEWDLLSRSTRSFLLKRCCRERCPVDSSQLQWIRQQSRTRPALNLTGATAHSDESHVEQHIARCNLGAHLALLTQECARDLQADLGSQGLADMSDYQKLPGASQSRLWDSSKQPLHLKLARPLVRTIQGLRFAVKFFVVASVADPDLQREIDYALDGQNVVFRVVAKSLLISLWQICRALQCFIIPWYLFYGRAKVLSLHKEMRGTVVKMGKNRLTMEGMLGSFTGFFQTPSGASVFTSQRNGPVEFSLYSGQHATQPENQTKLISVNQYGPGLLLRKKEEYTKEAISNVFKYEYPEQMGSRIPIQRHCVKGNREGEVVQYDERGHISSGSYLKDGNLVKFHFSYRKNARFDDELLRGHFELAHIKMAVSWCFPPLEHAERLETWLPYTKVTDATFVEGEKAYRSQWTYDHRSHPTIDTTLNGQAVDTPLMILHDWFGVLKKPTECNFLNENPLFLFRSAGSSVASRVLLSNRKRWPVSTPMARTHLWRSWKQGKDLDGVTVRWLDEEQLRSEQALRPYWLRRDFGFLSSGKEYLERNADAVMARSDIDPDISSWCSLAYKYSDLVNFGQGGDSKINTRRHETQIRDADDVLHVLAHDTGTWPNEGGGVSACRRDLVNNLQTIRWHVVAENANDFGIPKFQIEKNVQSLSVLPLWGMDFLTPTHGVFQDYRDSAVQQRLQNVSDADIRTNFFPILASLVKCARAIKFDSSHVEEASQALLDLNSYFATDRHWSRVWTSDAVKQRWRELWLSEDVTNARPLSQWLEAEQPTLLHLDTALDMWHRYLFIFSLPVPERIPDVFQASHHFAGASYGVLCKLRRNCSLHVWDHCISWREVTVFLSSAMSFDSPFVCSSLMQLSQMTSVLILHYADVVLPCADFFNPGWEIEHGTQEGKLQHRRAFARKIDPVVNGICDMEKFKPIEKIKTTKPTVTMLSHVRFVKDIKNAILAADIIVHEWGFKDYQLDIYGDMEKAPAYSVECKEILASKGLRDHVTLRGLGSPSKVLEESWLFLNSSISEGLPLAMGEAALTGVPVVCTDVGASFRVVTDPVTWKKFSAVIAPNDAHSLAKAQVEVLGLLGEWSKYAGDDPGFQVPKLSLHPTPDEVQAITDRMYEKSEKRRQLGMMGRANVLNSFSEGRYLREHEQMLWIGKQQSPRYLSRTRQMAAKPLELTAAHLAANISRPLTPLDPPMGTPLLRYLRLESPSPRYSAPASTASTSWSGS
ncbi:uncharacterized protein LTR77_004680 [Saxophila tyrrhenica]|uniref:Glycosyl transferase family 1 domain-containing protein n=1 Tax=Saxophila tyrrhenica TaxID=1690608 RepID=A0AAV9PA94_9PEZI|nr:hypothetical protein LTR77_004680 [Saxophila tyrrhenica]